MASNARNLTFGIEIECYIPQEAATFRIGSYHHGIQIPGLPQGWNAQRDGSIQAPAGKVGVEVVSPVLMGADGIQQVITVLAWLRSINAGCNASCGIHVHVGADKLTAWKVTGLVAQHERALFAACGAKGRVRIGNMYCGAIHGNSILRAQYNASRTAMPADPIGGNNRYQTLNLTNLLRGTRPAIEFRAFAATFRTEVVLGYIRICLGMVDFAAATKAPVKFESKQAGHDSTGAQQMQRLLRRLRWGKQDSKDIKRAARGCDWGWIATPGHDDAKAAIKSLMTMAKEFDQQLVGATA